MIFWFLSSCRTYWPSFCTRYPERPTLKRWLVSEVLLLVVVLKPVMSVSNVMPDSRSYTPNLEGPKFARPEAKNMNQRM